MKKKLVMIGNGMAGVRVVEEILKINPNLYEIVIFGKEPHPNYNRIQLSNVLQGETDFEDTIMNHWLWYEENNIQLFTGVEVTGIEPNTQTISTSTGETICYDELIIATGSVPFILPIPGAEKKESLVSVILLIVRR